MEDTKVKSFNLQKVFPIVLIQLVIAFVYFGAVILPWYDQKASLGLAVYQVFTHIFLFMFIWSYFRSVLGDPGRVPLYWGFFLDDPEHKKRRYCLLCHIFKPERCHHCSSCNRCVLNMDHHCPWINNCVGFYNRKFFMLMLIYVVLLTTCIFIGSSFAALSLYQKLNVNKVNMMIKDSIFVVAYVIDIIVMVMLTMFTSTHFGFVFNNTTTIEDLDKKRPNSVFSGTNYNMGGYYNWVQVFGRNPLLWPLPLFMDSGKPVGDGVVWPQANSVAKQS